MFLEAIIIGSIILAGIALVLYIDYLNEKALKEKLSIELPETRYVEIQSISQEYGKDWGISYKLKAHQRNGTSKNIEVRCNRSNLSRYSRIKM